MDQLISAFGIDLRLITIQLVNFGILLVALWYFLYTPVFKILDERKRVIEKGVRDAEGAALSLKNAEEEKGQIVTSAVAEAGEIVKRGEASAKRDAEAIRKDAQEQSARILADGQMKAESLAAEIRKKTEADIAKVAILAAEKILKERA